MGGLLLSSSSSKLEGMGSREVGMEVAVMGMEATGMVSSSKEGTVAMVREGGIGIEFENQN